MERGYLAFLPWGKILLCNEWKSSSMVILGKGLLKPEAANAFSV